MACRWRNEPSFTSSEYFPKVECGFCIPRRLENYGKWQHFSCHSDRKGGSSFIRDCWLPHLWGEKKGGNQNWLYRMQWVVKMVIKTCMKVHPWIGSFKTVHNGSRLNLAGLSVTQSLVSSFLAMTAQKTKQSFYSFTDSLSVVFCRWQDIPC